MISLVLRLILAVFVGKRIENAEQVRALINDRHQHINPEMNKVINTGKYQRINK